MAGEARAADRLWFVKCPVCEGTGELSEAVQAWDVAGAPVPRCPHCDDGTLDLRDMFGRAMENGWQPIATAPKDDTPILTYRRVGLMAVAAYFPHGDAEWCCTDGVHLLNVTHWMPLPPPPASTETERTRGPRGET